jgi:hypothetical protein
VNAEDTVREVINRHDPLGLLRQGAPSDEYENEIFQITWFAESAAHEHAMLDGVYSVYRDMFAPLELKKEDFRELAEELYERMQEFNESSS